MTATMRKIVHIDEDKCNGCGLCVPSCAEGAIQIVDGKAKLVSDVYCDGLGACLGPCPTGAISIVEREAVAFDQAAADRHVKKVRDPAAVKHAPAAHAAPHSGGGCPGSMARALKPEPKTKEQAPDTLACGCPGSMSRSLKEPEPCACSGDGASEVPAAKSELMNWPVQLKLIPPGAPYLQGADLLLAADCAAFAVGDFHRRFLRDRPLAIACPKLDDNEPYIEKLAQMIVQANLKSLTVVRMEVPCCGGLVRIAQEAIRRSGRDIGLEVAVVGVDGSIIN